MSNKILLIRSYVKAGVRKVLVWANIPEVSEKEKRNRHKKSPFLRIYNFSSLHSKILNLLNLLKVFKKPSCLLTCLYGQSFPINK